MSNKLRLKRAQKLRKKISGTKEMPRLSVYRSIKYIYGQIIDDSAGKTLVAASDKELKNKSASKSERASLVGQLLAQKAKGKKIAKVVFDRNGYKFHGRIKAMADAARKEGLIF